MCSSLWSHGHTFLISNDSLSSSASDTFHSVPSFFPVVPVPIQMSSMPRN